MPSRPSAQKIKLAGQVLAKIAAYDPSFRYDSDAIVMAWAEALTLANPPEDIALEAVAVMYSQVQQPNFRPLPGLLVSICRDIRNDRIARQPTEARERREDELDRRFADEQQKALASGTVRGLYCQEDPAGWPYAMALTRAERADAEKELNARIYAYMRKNPSVTQADAEHILRTKDRERAAKLLEHASRNVGHVIRAHAHEAPSRAFSEPIHDEQ